MPTEEAAIEYAKALYVADLIDVEGLETAVECAIERRLWIPPSEAIAFYVDLTKADYSQNLKWAYTSAGLRRLGSPRAALGCGRFGDRPATRR